MKEVAFHPSGKYPFEIHFWIQIAVVKGKEWRGGGSVRTVTCLTTRKLWVRGKRETDGQTGGTGLRLSWIHSCSGVPFL